jgi:hypothetical protein
VLIALLLVYHKGGLLTYLTLRCATKGRPLAWPRVQPLAPLCHRASVMGMSDNPAAST